MADGLYPCCQVGENLELQPQAPGQPDALELRVCTECGRRHFEMTVDPATLGLTFT